MRFYSPDTIQIKLDATMEEYKTVMSEMDAVPTVDDANQLVDIAQRAQALKDELDSLEGVETSGESLINALNISDKVMNSEATVISVIHVLGRASSLLNDVLTSGLTDDETNDVKRAITDNQDFADLKSNTANIPRSRGKLGEKKAVEYREMFKAAWDENPKIKLATFMRDNDIDLQYYSFNNLIHGTTYTEAGGPIRGVDYDIDDADDADDAGIPPSVTVVDGDLATV